MATIIARINEHEVWVSYDIQVEWKGSYRLGTSYNDDQTRFKWFQPTSKVTRVTGPVSRSATAWAQFLAGVPGAIPSPAIPTLPEVGAGYFGEPIRDILWRIWVVPSYLRPINPGLYVDIPFIVWSAYPVDNTLNSIGGTGQTGLTITLSAPRAFFPFEELEVNLQITDAAPNTISALYIFTFTLGSDTFVFETSILDWIKELPDVPVVETWAWLTDIITAEDGTEQRIAIRRQPRRTIQASFLLGDDVERQREYDRWYSRLATTVVVPFYQYSTRLTAGSSPPSSRLYFNPALTDFRAYEKAAIWRPTTEETYIVELGTLEADGANTSSPLTVDVLQGDIIAPAFEARLDNRTGPAMTSVSGKMDIKAEVSEFRPSFDRPGSTAVIDTFDGFNVLDRRPLADSEVPEIFDINPTVIDNVSGLHENRSSWLHPFISGQRRFKVPRMPNPAELDWWRDFVTAAVGQREPFLLPTFREDLFLDTTPPPANPTIDVTSTNYTTAYFPHDTYKRLRLVNPDGGVIYRKVTASVPVPGGATRLTLDTVLPNEAAWGNGFTIGWLNVARFGSDIFRLTHLEMDTILEANLRTIDG